jgi:hypothetical protein
MEKNLLQATYWLGLACVAIAILWRGLNAVAGISGDLRVTGEAITYWSFMRGGGALLLVAIATGVYISARSRSS